MPHFYVDDQFAFHPKAVAAGNAALGTWTRCGAWCKANATGGFVPTSVARSIGTSGQIARLVSVGLWDRVDGGYQFHDWRHTAGNGTPEEEKRRKERNAERQRRFRDKQSGETRDERITPGVSNALRDALVTGLPVPVPVTTDVLLSSVPEVRDQRDRTDDEATALAAQSLGYLDITDFPKVRTAVARATGRVPSPQQVVRIVTTILARSRAPKDPTAVVLSSVRNDWAEWQQLLDEEAS